MAIPEPKIKTDPAAGSAAFVTTVKDADNAIGGAKTPLNVADNNANSASLRALLKLEGEARSAETEGELAFVIANESRNLMRARQIFVFRIPTRNRHTIIAVNSQDSVDRNSGLIRWVQKILSGLQKDVGLDELREFSLPAYCDSGDEEAKVYPFGFFLWVPFKLRNGTVFGGMLLAREQVWLNADTVVAKRLGTTYEHAWAALRGKAKLKPKSTRRPLVLASLAVMLVAVSMIPVPLTVLAPVEVVAKNPFVVAAPIDGVVHRITVPPNTRVSPGTTIVEMVDTELRNNTELARREVDVAQAELQQNTQAAFDDVEAKKNLRIALTGLELKKSELAYSQDLLAKSKIKAPIAGIALFSENRDWIGRPVSTGERILQIADPNQIHLRIDIPVSDALVLQTGARVKVFLDIDPISPFAAQVTYPAHEAQMGEDGTLSFPVKAEFNDSLEGRLPRIGSRGTAQVFGETTSLFYFLFRRPLSALRQYTGI